MSLEQVLVNGTDCNLVARLRPMGDAAVERVAVSFRFGPAEGRQQIQLGKMLMLHCFGQLPVWVLRTVLAGIEILLLPLDL